VDDRNGSYATVNGCLISKDGTAILRIPPRYKQDVFVVAHGTVSIGTASFSGCSLIKSITIPSSVTSIGEYAFTDCTSLKSITIPSSVTSVGDSAFDGCGSLEEVGGNPSARVFSEIEKQIGRSLSGIKDKGTRWELPEDAKSFEGNQKAFWTYDKRTKELTIGGKGLIDDFNYGETPWSDIRVEKVTIQNGITSIGDNAFSGCTSLQSITIPDGVTSIGTWAFWFCTSLQSITIPPSVTSIGINAFSRCTSLQSITIPPSVTSIGNWAFNECESLQSITIPPSVTSIGVSVFSGCKSLEEVQGNPSARVLSEIEKQIGRSLSGSKQSVGKDTGKKQKAVKYGVSLEGNSKAFWTYDKRTKELTIGGNGRMDDFVSGKKPWSEIRVEKVTILPGITTIGERAFDSCASLQSITIPDGVRSIGERAFDSCASLQSITVPGSVNCIGKYAFSRCTSLKSITILDGVKSIEYYAFSRCTSLKSITIPSSVTSIGDSVFFGCKSLEEVQGNPSAAVLSEIEKQIGRSLFDSKQSGGKDADTKKEFRFGISLEGNSKASWTYDGRTKELTIAGMGSIDDFGPGKTPWSDILVEKVTIKTGITSIGDRAFQGCTYLNSISIPSSVTSIRAFAFQGCTSLETITIPSSVTSIGKNAFSGCTSLQSVTIPSGVSSIGDLAFLGCESLKSITIPSSVTSIGTFAFYGCGSPITVKTGLKGQALGQLKASIDYRANASYTLFDDRDDDSR